MKWQFVWQLLKRVKAFYDKILLSDTEHFKQVILSCFRITKMENDPR